MTFLNGEEAGCRSALAASIVHEVHQPLTGMILNAATCLRMLSADPPDIAGAQDTARRLLRDGERATQIVARLRTLFARAPAQMEPVDLNDAAREAVAMYAGELQRQHVSVRTELENGLPRITGDRLQLQQVIVNLILNACEAMAEVEPSSRRLLIRTAGIGAGHVTLHVTDTGTGLDVHIRERLFQPFCTTKSNGMGIGLFVSRSIVERHHGSLQAGQNDGPGATFSISLPCACTTEAEPAWLCDSSASPRSPVQAVAGGSAS